MSDEVKVTSHRGVGQPTKYTEDMPDLIIDFFNVDPGEYLIVTRMESGKTDYCIVAKNFPTLMKFARTIGVHRDTLYEWGNVHPEFKRALAEAKLMQEEAIVNIGISTNGQFSNFMLKCNHGWRDNDDLNVGTGDSGEVTVVFKRGKSKDERDAEQAEQEAQQEEDGD